VTITSARAAAAAEALVTHEILQLCSNVFQLQLFSILSQSFFQILSATPMTTPQAFRSTPIEFNFFYNNLLDFFALRI